MVSVEDLSKQGEVVKEIVKVLPPKRFLPNRNKRNGPAISYRSKKVKFLGASEVEIHPKFAIDKIDKEKPMQVRLSIKIGRERLRACIDTGASRTLMSLEQWKKLSSPGLRIRPSNVALVACGSSPIKVHGTDNLTFRVRGNKESYNWPFVISDSWSPHHDCILGVDFLVRVGARIDLLTETIVFQRQLTVPSGINMVEEDSRVCLKATEEVVLEPNSGKWVSGRADWPDPEKPNWEGAALYESAVSYGRGVTIAEALVNVVEDHVSVWAENRTPHEYVIPREKVLGWLSDKDDVRDWIMEDRSSEQYEGPLSSHRDVVRPQPNLAPQGVPPSGSPLVGMDPGGESVSHEGSCEEATDIRLKDCQLRESRGIGTSGGGESVTPPSDPVGVVKQGFLATPHMPTFGVMRNGVDLSP